MLNKLSNRAKKLQLWGKDIISISQNVSHEMISLKDMSESEKKSVDARLGDKNFVCFRFREL